MTKEYNFYHVDVFKDLILVLKTLEDEIEQIPVSVKCFPTLDITPHVHMADTTAFRKWAKDNKAVIVPSDSPGHVKLLVRVVSVVVYALIPAEGAEEWGERL